MTYQNWMIQSAAIMLGLTVPALAANTDNQSEAFYSAIRANDLARLEELLKQPANANTPSRANTRDERGMTPLMYAAAVGSPEAMKLLIDKGADVNARNAFNSTALMWSITDLKKVRLLVDHGADVNAASKQGRTALLLAAKSDRSAAIVRLLIAKGADIKAVDARKDTALIAASEGNDLETIKLLVDAGLDVNAANGGGFTPLMNAASNSNLAAAKLLLAKGAKVNAVTAEGLEIVKNGPIALGKFTALLVAGTYGPPDLVKALLDAGAEVNVQDVRGMTPLMLAVGTDLQNPEIIRMLLAKGADPKIKSLAGETALDWARKVGPKSAVESLKSAGAVETGPRAIPVAVAAPVALKPAVERSIALLEKTSSEFFMTGGCAACHSQNITDFAVSAAKAKGVPVNEQAAIERQKLNKAFFGAMGPALLERTDTPGSPDLPLYALAAMAATGYAPDRMTDAMLANVVAQQASDGRWHIGFIARPPIEDGDIFRTALGIRAIKAYGPPGRAAEMKERVERARKWLQAAKTVTTEDRGMQLMGLRWAGVEENTLEPWVKAIVAEQRRDGGWAQRAELESDAYATGQSLVALQIAGLRPADPVYQKGVKYLLETQCADGSWHVRSRAPKFQPYFESGFPYGHDQWISSMATGWATVALANAIEQPALKAHL